METKTTQITSLDNVDIADDIKVKIALELLDQYCKVYDDDMQSNTVNYFMEWLEARSRVKQSEV